jgi:hypothetical protein
MWRCNYEVAKNNVMVLAEEVETFRGDMEDLTEEMGRRAKMR